MKCHPIGKQFEPERGADKWILKKDHTVEVLYEEFQTIAEGGWRNKVIYMALPLCVELHTENSPLDLLQAFSRHTYLALRVSNVGDG